MFSCVFSLAVLGRGFKDSHVCEHRPWCEISTRNALFIEICCKGKCLWDWHSTASDIYSTQWPSGCLTARHTSMKDDAEVFYTRLLAKMNLISKTFPNRKKYDWCLMLGPWPNQRQSAWLVLPSMHSLTYRELRVECLALPIKCPIHKYEVLSLLTCNRKTGVMYNWKVHRIKIRDSGSCVQCSHPSCTAMSCFASPQDV
jgi:hypothetical protein